VIRASRVEHGRGGTADGVELAVEASNRLLARLSTPPGTVVDARPPGMRAGATATYRLAAALGLRRASPVAVQVPGAASALTALSLLLQAAAVDGSAPLLVVTGSAARSPEAGSGPCVAVLAVAPDTGRPTPETPFLVAPGAAPRDGAGEGFYELAVEVHDGAERCLRAGVGRVATRSLVIDVEETIDDATARG
jgi:hypothetical protein